MKKILLLLATVSLLCTTYGSAQTTAAVPPSAATVQAEPAEPVFTSFDLDFPGGTPLELVTSIEKATGRRLNVIIPTEHAGLTLPPLKMSHVTAPELFAALSRTSFQIGGLPANLGFETNGRGKGDATIWYFAARGPFSNQRLQPKMTRYFLLTPYLDTGLKVEDIITAINTGWKMLNEKDPLPLTYHKETKLLIAVADPMAISLIESVLMALPKATPPAVTRSAAPTPEQEQARLNAVADEVARRRSVRDEAQRAVPASKPGQKSETVEQPRPKE